MITDAFQLGEHIKSPNQDPNVVLSRRRKPTGDLFLQLVTEPVDLHVVTNDTIGQSQVASGERFQRTLQCLLNQFAKALQVSLGHSENGSCDVNDALTKGSLAFLAEDR